MNKYVLFVVISILFLACYGFLRVYYNGIAIDHAVTFSVAGAVMVFLLMLPGPVAFIICAKLGLKKLVGYFAFFLFSYGSISLVLGTPCHGFQTLRRGGLLLTDNGQLTSIGFWVCPLFYLVHVFIYL